ncbi:MAG: hypothetical protein AAF352_03460 [Pseudomonadota bacterium]
MRVRELQQAGEKLAAAFDKNVILPEFPCQESPKDRAEAFIVQDTFLDILRDDVSGWKLGATAQELYEDPAHDGATMGRVFAKRDFAGGAQLPAKLFHGARVECEFGFVALQDVSCDAMQTMQPQDLVGGDHPVFALIPCAEFVGLRFASTQENPLEVLADNAANVGLVRGAIFAQFPTDIDFLHHLVSLQINDRNDFTQLSGKKRCQPVHALCDGLQKLAARAIAITQGQVITTGSATVPQVLQAGDHVCCDFDPFGTVEFSLR